MVALCTFHWPDAYRSASHVPARQLETWLGRSQMTAHCRRSRLLTFFTSRAPHALSPGLCKRSACMHALGKWTECHPEFAGSASAGLILGPDSPATANMGRTDVLACDVRRPRRAGLDRWMHPG